MFALFKQSGSEFDGKYCEIIGDDEYGNRIVNFGPNTDQYSVARTSLRMISTSEVLELLNSTIKPKRKARMKK